jgi:hypothetical protein
MSQEFLIEQSRTSYVDLPAIIGGALVALAISFVFMQFAGAIGLSITDDTHWTGETPWTGNTALAGVIAASLWVLWTQVTSSMAGGYLAGRMRRPVAGAMDHEREIRDGAHGLLVWAAGTVAVAIAVGFSAALAAFAPEQAGGAAREMTDVEQNAVIIFAFVAASSSLLSAVAAWWAATMGGEHRDKVVDHSRYISFRRT